MKKTFFPTQETEIVIKKPNKPNEVLTSKDLESLNIDYQKDKISITIELK